MALEAADGFALVWFSPEVARAVVDVPYSEAIEAFEGLLAGLPSGSGLLQGSRAGRSALSRGGGTVAARIPRTSHSVALVRPYEAPGGTGARVFVAVVGHGDLAGPIVAAGAHAARDQARAFNARAGHALPWRRFDVDDDLWRGGDRGRRRVVFEPELRAALDGRPPAPVVDDELVLPTDVLRGDRGDRS
jgi:hypothetical protein